MINVSRWRCDALICTVRGVSAIQLPQLTLDGLNQVARRYLQALTTVEAAVADMSAAKRAALALST